MRSARSTTTRSLLCWKTLPERPLGIRLASVCSLWARTPVLPTLPGRRRSSVAVEDLEEGRDVATPVRRSRSSAGSSLPGPFARCWLPNDNPGLQGATMSNPYRPGSRFPSINQGPTGMPEAQAPDPPGFYMGWPLASLLKRCMSGVLDYGVFFFVAVVIASLLAAVVRAVAGESAGAAASLLLVGAAYCASLYNFSVLQSRTGQTWGKGIVGVRAVDMVQLTPPGKLILG